MSAFSQGECQQKYKELKRKEEEIDRKFWADVDSVKCQNILYSEDWFEM